MNDTYYTKKYCVSSLRLIQSMTRLQSEKDFLEERIRIIESMTSPACRKGFYQTTVDIITDPFNWQQYK